MGGLALVRGAWPPEGPAAFLELTGVWLRRAEARNQLVLGIAANAVAGRKWFSPFHG